MIVAAVLFLPRGISPAVPGHAGAGRRARARPGRARCSRSSASSSRSAARPIETSFAGAYNLAQFFGWRWGKKERPAAASRFTLSWIVIFALALLVVMTGYDPVKLTEYSVIFSVVALPLTYLPILLVANDRTLHGRAREREARERPRRALLRRDPRDRDRGDPADAASRTEGRDEQARSRSTSRSASSTTSSSTATGATAARSTTSRSSGLDGDSPEVDGDPRRRQRLALARAARAARRAALGQRRARAVDGGRRPSRRS